MQTLVENIKRTERWTWLPDLANWALEQAVAIQQIPAPTFQEQARARYVTQQFNALGLTEIETDSLYNVYGVLRGINRGLPGLMISAHTDTVFAEDTILTTRRDGDVIYGPGLGDNSMGVAGLLALAAYYQRQRITPECDLWFVATTREEGLGDLGGMRAAFAKIRPNVGAVINLEGLAFGHVYHAGIAVRRLKVSASAPGGHSWLHFGRPSAIHAIMRIGAQITTIHPPPDVRTTYNIGMIEGGQTINSIATSASLWLDMRSESLQGLSILETQVREAIAAAAQPDLTLNVEIVGDRPAGTLPTTHPLVQGALAALAQVGVRGTLETGSTDANIPLSEQVPAVTIGITRGGNAHRLDEFIEIKPIEAGLQQLVLLTQAAAAHQVH
jgi:tripeptide aminopeptidase